MITIEQLAEGYGHSTQRLFDLLNNRFAHQQTLAAAKRKCEEAKAAVILQHADDPKALGANVETRDAKIRELCAEPYDLLQTLEQRALTIDHETALVRLRLDEMKFYRDLHQIQAQAVSA